MKTPEELAKQYGDEWFPGEPKEHYITVIKELAFLAGYQAAKDQLADADKVMSNWIKCSEQMPSCYGEYLLFIKSTTSSWEETQLSDDEIVRKRVKYITRSIEISEGHSRGWAFRQTNDVEVTHWMPLPIFPKEDE